MYHVAYIAALTILLLSGCAGGPESPADAPQGETPAGRTGYPRISLTQEASTLGDTVRTLGTKFPGGLVVMNGIQEKGIAPVAWTRKPYDAAVRWLAEETVSQVEFRAGYYFLYPPGYESLAVYSLAGRVPAAYKETPLAVNIGAGTALFDAFSLLSYHTRKTIIASNAIAEEHAGEIALSSVPPIHAVEALLQSARLPEAQLRVSVAADYLFIDAAIAEPRGPFRLEAPGTVEEEAILDQRVTATLPALPESVEGFVFYGAPLPFGEMLGALSAQTGVRVTCAPALANVPVNPCTFVDLPLGTVLDLLLWQWPVGGFGYEVRDGGVLIRPVE